MWCCICWQVIELCLQLKCKECSGSVVECLTRDHGFEPHWCHCVGPWKKTHHKSQHSTGSTQEYLSQHNRKIVDRDVKNQIKQNSSKVNRSSHIVHFPTQAFRGGGGGGGGELGAIPWKPRNDIVSFWCYRSNIRTKLKAPVCSHCLTVKGCHWDLI